MTNIQLQKKISRILDIEANRAESIGMRPASGKQCWFLAKLMVDFFEPAALIAMGADSHSVLTSAEASRKIEFYLSETQKAD